MVRSEERAGKQFDIEGIPNVSPLPVATLLPGPLVQLHVASVGDLFSGDGLGAFLLGRGIPLGAAFDLFS